MKPFLLVAWIAGVALVLGGSAAGAPVAERAAALTSYSDPAGDSGAAPDITNVDVGNDSLTGALVFWIEMPNRPTFGANDALFVFIDTDSNSATGDPLIGSEYSINVVGSNAGLFRWNGSDWVGSPSGSLTAGYSESDKAQRVEIHPNDLGGVSTFTFLLGTFAGEAIDVAPDGEAVWQYAPRPERFALVFESQSITPNPPRAGRTLTVAVQFARPDLNELVEEGVITCTLKVGGKTLRATTRTFRNGFATCVWRLPASAKGKRLIGTVRLTFGGTSAQRAFSLKAR